MSILSGNPDKFRRPDLRKAQCLGRAGRHTDTATKALIKVDLRHIVHLGGEKLTALLAGSATRARLLCC